MSGVADAILTKKITAAADMNYRCFVDLTGNPGGNPTGALRDPVKAGQLADLIYLGTAYIRVGAGGVTKNVGVKTDADGKAVKCGSGDVRNGVALEDGVEGFDAKVFLITQTIEP